MAIARQSVGKRFGQNRARLEIQRPIEGQQFWMTKQPDGPRGLCDCLPDQAAGDVLPPLGRRYEQAGQPMTLSKRLKAEGGENVAALGYPELFCTSCTHRGVMSPVELVEQRPHDLGEQAVLDVSHGE